MARRTAVTVKTNTEERGRIQVTTNTPRERRAAALRCCEAAVDVAEAREFLAMLGLDRGALS